MSRNRSTAPVRRPTSRRPSFRPCCEPLESRWVPVTVTNLDDAGPGSLRQAILDTPPGEVVDFEKGLTGTITLTTGELAIRQDVIIISPSAEVIAVSGGNRSRVFSISAGANVEIYGLTVRNGSVTADGATAGGILNAGNLLLYGSNVLNNGTVAAAAGLISSASGGGIRNTGTLTILFSTIADNRISAPPPRPGGVANALGGGIVNAGILAIHGSVVSGNTAAAAAGVQGTRANALGGGIFNEGTLTIQDSLVSANALSSNGRLVSTATGAGINNVGTLGVSRSLINNNTASGDGGMDGGFVAGGGIHSTGTVAVVDSTISDNTARGNGRNVYGGGIASGAGSSTTVSNSTISGNTADTGNVQGGSSAFGGGLMAYSGGQVRITHTTITNNSLASHPAAPQRGGGVALLSPSSVALRNTLVASNGGREGPDFWGTVASEGYNLIGDGSSSSGFGKTDLVGTPDEPIDPLLGPLEDNGGPTPTHALLEGSPALDAGDPTDAPEFDQRGEGYPRIAGDNIDIGAFEFQGKGGSPGAGAPGQDFAPQPVELVGLDAAGTLLWLSRSRSPAW